VTRWTLSLLSQLIAFLLFIALRAALMTALGDDGAGTATSAAVSDDNVGIVPALILTAVFFTIVHLTGGLTIDDGAARAIRLPLNVRVWWLVLVEALLLCVVGSSVGFGLTLLFEPESAEPIVSRLGRLATSWDSMVMGVATALIIGSVLASPRVWFTRRMLDADSSNPSETERAA
jgi:hypothetical protein